MVFTSMHRAADDRFHQAPGAWTLFSSKPKPALVPSPSVNCVVQDRRQVRRFCDWMSAGWTVKTDANGDMRFCHWGARKIAKVVICEEDAPEAAEIGDFLLSFT